MDGECAGRQCIVLRLGDGVRTGVDLVVGTGERFKSSAVVGREVDGLAVRLARRVLVCRIGVQRRGRHCLRVVVRDRREDHVEELGETLLNADDEVASEDRDSARHLSARVYVQELGVRPQREEITGNPLNTLRLVRQREKRVETIVV